MKELNNFREKWGEKTSDYGWVAIPSILFFYQKELDINPTEMNVLTNLLLHWWESDKKPYPAQSSIARRMGVSTRTVQRALDSLDEKKIITKNRTSIHSPVYKGRNIYDLAPLVKILNSISSQEPNLKSYIAKRPSTEEKVDLIKTSEQE